MKLEDFEEKIDAIYWAMDSTKLLGICKMWLSQLNIAWTQVEELISRSSFNGFFFFAEVWYMFTQY